MGEVINFPSGRKDDGEQKKPEMIVIPEDIAADLAAKRRRQAMHLLGKDIIDKLPDWPNDHNKEDS